MEVSSRFDNKPTAHDPATIDFVTESKDNENHYFDQENDHKAAQLQTSTTQTKGPSKGKVDSPPTNNKVDSPPTNNKVDSPPTSNKVDSLPTSNKVDSPPTNNKVDSPPTNNKNDNNPSPPPSPPTHTHDETPLSETTHEPPNPPSNADAIPHDAPLGGQSSGYPADDVHAHPQLADDNQFNAHPAHQDQPTAHHAEHDHRRPPDSKSGKLFLGGLSYGTTEQDVRSHFANHGDVIDAVVMKDKFTRKSRGFGFVTFADAHSAADAVKVDHDLGGRIIDVKFAIPRERSIRNRNSSAASSGTSQHASSNGGHQRHSSNGHHHHYQSNTQTKVFVGGLPSAATERDLRSYFLPFGNVTDAIVMFDRETHRSRGFGFVTFDNQEAVNRICAITDHSICGKWVEIKRAETREQIASRGGVTHHSRYSPQPHRLVASQQQAQQMHHPGYSFVVTTPQNARFLSQYIQQPPSGSPHSPQMMDPHQLMQHHPYKGSTTPGEVPPPNMPPGEMYLPSYGYVAYDAQQVAAAPGYENRGPYPGMTGPAMYAPPDWAQNQAMYAMPYPPGQGAWVAEDFDNLNGAAAHVVAQGWQDSQPQTAQDAPAQEQTVIGHLQRENKQQQQPRERNDVPRQLEDHFEQAMTVTPKTDSTSKKSNRGKLSSRGGRRRSSSGPHRARSLD